MSGPVSGPGHPGHGPRVPAQATPARPPGSVRRTSTVDAAGGRDLAGVVTLRGRAQDLVTDGAGAGHRRNEASIEVEVDRSGRRPVVVRVDVDPLVPGIDGVLGAGVPGGFRGALARAVPDLVRSATPLHLLLDDVPGALIASGYAAAVEPPPDVPSGLGGTPPVDVCSGWRSDGVMMVALRRDGRLPPISGPRAVDLGAADPAGWHPPRTLTPGEVRRRRRLDVTPSGDVLLIDAMFRDSYADLGGGSSVVHEYGLTARVDRASGLILAIQAEPRVLPWVECPLAGDSASRLIGTDVRRVREEMRGGYTGITTCTHLNDLLRSLADVAALAELLDGPPMDGPPLDGPRAEAPAVTS